jgi:hypothetical protein
MPESCQFYWLNTFLCPLFVITLIMANLVAASNKGCVIKTLLFLIAMGV